MGKTSPTADREFASEHMARARKLPAQIEYELESGTLVTTPADAKFAIGIIDDIDTGLDILCKVFGIGCGGGGGGGGGSGCYTIITPDGTTITICPPQKVIA